VADVLVVEEAELEMYGDWCALVVNLARRQDRLQRMHEVFAARAPKILQRLERVDAVDGRLLSFDDAGMEEWLQPDTLANAKRAKELKLYTVVHDENNLLVHFDDHFTEGAVACALSHHKALQRIATHPTAEWGLLFEDDVSKVVPDVELAIARVLRKLPSDWDAVYLGYHHDDGKPHPAAEDPSIVDTEPVDVAVDLVSSHCWGLFSLMIRKEAAQGLVDHLFPLRTQVDCAVSSWLVRQRGRTYKVPPGELLFYSSCSEEAQDTDIQTMKREADIVEEYGSIAAYRQVQKQRPMAGYDEELLQLFAGDREGEAGDEDVQDWWADSFNLVGSFNDWTIGEGADGDILRISQAGVEEFQIVGDGSWEKRVYPAGGTAAGVVAIRAGEVLPAATGDGGARRGHGRNWSLVGKPGSSFRISFDQEAKTIRCDEL